MKRKLSGLFILNALLSVPAAAEAGYEAGGYLRVRHEYWKNIFDLENSGKDNRNYFRIKTSLWGKAGFGDNISAFVKLTDEFKSYTYYYQGAGGKKNARFDIDETVFDNLYADIRNCAGLPLDLRVGRQDFLGGYGEGFLIMDGTPLDGSRTFYFNAVKAAWNINADNSLDMVCLASSREDDMLIINEKVPHQQLNTSDERAFMLYWKNRSEREFSIENYYIYKEEDGGGSGLQAEKGEINTIGSFMKYNGIPWRIRAQAALQAGDYGEHDRRGYGGYVFVDRDIDTFPGRPVISLGVVCLSGDDPSTDKNEAWDPLFSRWPWLSELYALTFNGESGMGYWTNLQLWRVEASVRPGENRLKLKLAYNFLRALETPSGAAFGRGKTRGHLPQVRVDYELAENVNAYVTAEYFLPGNFYPDDRDSALFLRTEISFKF